MSIRIYPRVIDLVSAVRRDGGVPKNVKYNSGKPMYYAIIEYLEREYRCTHKMAMDAAKYFMY